MKRTRGAVLAVAADALGLLCLAGAVVVLVTGGGDFRLGGNRVSVHHASDILLATFILFVLRFRLIPRTALLGVPGLSLDRLAGRAVRWLTACHDALTRATGRQVLGIGSVVIAVSLVVKLLVAWTFFGFMVGDDVEIHHITLSRLLGFEFTAWDLRNTTYPFVFIYPLQWLVHGIGDADPWHLVYAGRVAVILFSCLNLWLVYRIACREFGAVAVGILALALLAVDKQAVVHAASVLPRTVTTTFVLLGYEALARRRAGAVVLGGALLGFGAALRFSEVVFAVPAALELIGRRRGRDLVLLTLAFASAAAAVLAVSDQIYWGRPFASLVQFARYTLFEGESSRGFQSPLHYLFGVRDWVSVPVFLLAVYMAWRRRWRGLLWIGAPIVLLSALPHKETRYLVPILPFMAMAAAWALWDLAERFRAGYAAGRYGGGRALGLVALFALIVALNIDGYHASRSEQAVLAARYLARQEPKGPAVLDWGWRMGGWIYLSAFGDLRGWLPLEQVPREELRALVGERDLAWLALRDPTIAHLGGADSLSTLGWRRLVASESAAGNEIRLFRRGEAPTGAE